MLSVIGQPVPFLVLPHEVRIIIPVITNKANKISFFIFLRLIDNIHLPLQK